MSKPFSIQDYLSKNKIEVGSIKKEVGDTPFKGGNNDIRKTNYDVNIVDGKLDLYTHKEIITEVKKTESRTIKVETSVGIVHIEIESDAAGVFIDVIVNRKDVAEINIENPTGNITIKQKSKRIQTI